MAGCRFLIWTVILSFVALVWPGLTSSLVACPFCSVQGKTLTEQMNDVNMVLFGRLANPQLDNNGGLGTTEFHIEAVLKKHDFVAGKKMVIVPRYLPTDNKENRFLLLCDVYKGNLDPLGVVTVKDKSDLVKYLEGALAAKGKDVGSRLRFFFDYLDNPETEISNDAYKEFGYADYKDYRAMAKGLPADKIAKWLKDPDTPGFRLGLYASMLGHCGTDKDAALLRKMLDDPQKRLTTGIDGILAGYTLLKPKDGWSYLRGIYKDDKKDFTIRYAALRAARFFWDSRSDVVDKNQVVDGISLLLDDGNMADLAIEDLRKWGREELIDKVLALYAKPSHDVPVVRRSILRYALWFPKNAKAKAFVGALRMKDPEMVKDAEELLKFDLDTGPPKTGPGK